MSDSIIGNEFLPNVHIEKISYQIINRQTSKARVTISLYDTFDRTWSIDDKFRGYLRVILVGAYSKSLIDNVTSGDTRINKLVSGDLYTQEIITEFMESDVFVDGVRYRKLQATKNLEFNSAPHNLTLFASAEIDLATLKANEGLSLSYAQENYLGSVTGEDILRAGEKVKMANIFYVNQNTAWAGPVHLHEDTVYMEGSKHVITPHAELRLSKTINNKLKYLPSLNYKGEGPLLINSSTSPQNMPLTYEQDYVQDADGNVSCAVMADLYNLSLQESKTAAIMYNNDPQMFHEIAGNLDIKNIEVKRHSVTRSNHSNAFNLPVTKLNMSDSSVIARSFNNSKKLKEKVMYQITSTEKLSVDPTKVQATSKVKIFDGKEITPDILRQGKKVGSIKQLNLTLPKNIRPITFTDYEIKEIRGVEHGFSIKLQIEDNFLKYTKSLLRELLSSAHKLQGFYNTLEAKNAFDGDKFKIDFLVSYYSQYGITISEDTGTIVSEIDLGKLKNIFIFKAFENLKIAERLSGLTMQSDHMLESFNLFTADMMSINRAITYYNKVIEHYRRTYNVNNEKKYGKTSSRSPRKDRPLIEKTIKIKKTYKKPMLPKIGFNYISRTKHEALKKISLSELTQRANIETKKYFKSPPSKTNPLLKDMSDDDKRSFVDLDSNKFKYFSPSRVFFGTKEVDTTELNPESMEVNFFNNLKITRSLIGDTSEEQYSLIDREEDLELYVDSREYLGDDTKFNNAVLKVLRKTPLKLNKIRKEFRLLDKSILKTKTKKVSLDTFDLSSKNNTVKKSFSKKPTEIPVQVKALSLLRSNSTNFDVNNLEFDPLANPQTDEVMKQNFMNIGKIEYLDGFETVNGIPMLNKPIFKEITTENYEMLRGKNVLCQIKNTNFDNLTIDDSQNFQIFDKVFTIESSEEEQINIETAQPLSEDVNDMVEVFTDTLLSPVFYSSTIISQNPDNASVVEPLKKVTVERVDTTTQAIPQTTIVRGNY